MPTVSTTIMMTIIGIERRENSEILANLKMGNQANDHYLWGRDQATTIHSAECVYVCVNW